MSNDRIQVFLDDPKSYLSACAAMYAKVRYLRHVHDGRLNSRGNDIIANLWTADASGMATHLNEPSRREFFTRLYVEFQEEQRLRTGGPEIDFNEGAIITKASAAYTAPRLTSTAPTLAQDALVRFGKYVHLEGALTHGKIRIAPASSYNDPSLNAAQFDEELQHQAITPNEQMKLKIFGRRTLEGPEEEVPVIPLELCRYMNVPPFYVLCLSSCFDYRMFHDFKEADVALVIHDRVEFGRRVNAAMALAVDAEPAMGGVQYYDPYQVRREQLKPGFSKHFKYAYQQEVRMIWRPKSATTPKAVFVEAGSLRDIAELVRTA